MVVFQTLWHGDCSYLFAAGVRESIQPIGGNIMKKRYVKGVIAILVIGAVGVFSVNAFAGRGRGPMGWGGGQGGQGYGPCGGPGYASSLSAEDVEKLKEQRQAFFDATGDIRREKHQKRLSLRSELAKKDPDPAAAKALQQEISSLQAQLDEKRLDHLLEMKKINPDAGNRWMMGRDPGGRWMNGGANGYGPGQGKGWHQGPWSDGQNAY
jgi:zinc resistance-associated protein